LLAHKERHDVLEENIQAWAIQGPDSRLFAVSWRAKTARDLAARDRLAPLEQPVIRGRRSDHR
jgi:hypothetical protein